MTEIARHDRAYIILFLTRHNGPIDDHQLSRWWSSHIDATSHLPSLRYSLMDNASWDITIFYVGSWKVISKFWDIDFISIILYHICRCSRTYILINLIHQLHNVFLPHRTSGCTDSWSNHWAGIQVARARCQDAHATAARMSLKVGIADSMQGNNEEHFTKTSCCQLSKKNRIIYIVESNHVEMFLCSFYVKTTTTKIHKLQKPDILSLWFTNLRIPVSTFRNVYVN